MKRYLSLVIIVSCFTSCVAKRLLTQSQMQTAILREDSARLADKISSLQNNISDLNAKIASLSNQNNQLGQQTAEQQNQLSQSKETLQQQQQTVATPAGFTGAAKSAIRCIKKQND